MTAAMANCSGLLIDQTGHDVKMHVALYGISQEYECVDIQQINT